MRFLLAAPRAAWFGFAAVCGGSAPAQAASFDCVINPSLVLKIGSPVSTTLTSITVDRGDRVEQGQVIAQLESSVEAADVALNTARAASTSDIVSHAAKFEFAQAELNRSLKLLDNANVAREKVDELRTGARVAQEDLQIAVLNHRLAELDLDRSRVLLEQRVIRSPISGIVVQRMLGPGEFVHQDAQIVEIAATSPVYVEAYPPVRVFGALHAGDTAQVVVDVPVGRTYTATVKTVDQVFDAGSGTFGVRFAIPNTDKSLPAGLRCRVTIDVKEPAPAPHAG